MEIGIKPDLNVEYQCFRSVKDNMIISKIFYNNEYFLITTDSILRGEPVYYYIEVDIYIESDINSVVDWQLTNYRTPTAIVMNNWSALKLASILSFREGLKTLQIPNEYRGLPILISPSTNNILVTVENNDQVVIARGK